MKKIKSFHCIKGIRRENKWKTIIPDKYGDWINQRDDSFYQFMPIGDKKSKNKNAIFNLYSCGVHTSRDSWVYNFDKSSCEKNIKNMIKFYNQEQEKLKNKDINKRNVDQFISLDEKSISWSDTLKRYFLRRIEGRFKKTYIRKSSYRPFIKSWLYFDNMFNDRVSQNPKIFPKENIKNKVICISGVGSRNFSVLMTDFVPCGDYLSKTQCFPLYWFDEKQLDDNQKNLLTEGKPSYSITDSALNRFKNHYKKFEENNLKNFQTKTKNKMVTLKIVSEGNSKKTKTAKEITKEDIFYYIYGLLHSEDYRKKYKSNLDKDLPRIPLVPEFWEFSRVGHNLADLHLNYENQSAPAEVKILKQGKATNISEIPEEELRVKKMKVNKMDKTKIQFNEYISISNIPEKAWEYKINGWSAPKWILERYQYKQNKKTDLVNDPNSYSENPAYILKLLLSVITVSLKTQDLVQSLPSINFDKLIASTKKQLKNETYKNLKNREL